WIDPPVDFSKGPDAFGDEHEVWLAGGSVIKVAYPDFFGLRVVFREDESSKCLPSEYFERWVLHNELFGDDIEVIGVIDTTGGVRTVLKQQAIRGGPATEGEIEGFFIGN